MEIELVPTPQPNALEAARRAVTAVVPLERDAVSPYRSDWRLAALADGVDRGLGLDGVERDLGQSPSPRSSRGATRA